MAEPPVATPRTDRGLQPERTALAWQRTAITFVGAALLFLRWGGEHGAAVGVLVAVAILTATWLFFHTRIRLRRIAIHFPAPGLEPATTEILAVTTATVLLAGAALWVTLAT
ncbi:MAG: DUF202 domain-containing protein [Knoellia sp.]